VPIVVDDKTKGDTQAKSDDSSGKNGEQATASDPSPADNKLAAGTKASDVPANPIATGDRPQQQRQPMLDVPSQGANATPLRDFKEISRLLGVSDLVVDMTAFFTLKKKSGKQPSPEIISALDGLSKRGIGPASAELGIDYLYGIGVPQNDSTAISYLKTAVEQRQPAARFMLGQIYLDGKLITADPAKGSELLTLAVREGFQPAVQLAQKSKIDPARMGMTASQLIQMAISGNRQTVDASNAFINEGLASGYAALAYYAVMYSKDEALKKQAAEFAANAARAGLDTGFGALTVLHANPDFGTPNLNEAAMWLALSARICGEPAACTPTEANLTALKKKLEPSVANYLDHIDEHVLAVMTNSSP